MQGENPPYGADLNFSLKSATPNVQVSIAGPNDAAIRTLTVAGHPGLNRVWWDLRYDNGSTITMGHIAHTPGEGAASGVAPNVTAN